MTWIVELTSEAEVQLIHDLRAGFITRDDIAVLRRWISEIETHGLKKTQRDLSWRDHALFRQWWGHRSISFSYAGRVIYRCEGETVQVVKITHDHDYS